MGLILFIYFNDKKEKEPFGLLVALFFAGMSTVISAVLLEYAGIFILDLITPTETTILGAILSATMVVAPAEEMGKFLILRIFTWKNRHFNYSYDAIVYAVFVSLGFAALENINYVFDGGIGTDTHVLRYSWDSFTAGPSMPYLRIIRENARCTSCSPYSSPSLHTVSMMRSLWQARLPEKT